MNTKDHIFIKACLREPVERTPVWIMRQAGRYLPEYRKIREKADFLTLCKTPELAAEVTIQPVDIIDVDAAILFSDILVVPEAMGMDLELIESKGPVFHNPIRSGEQVESLTIPDVHEKLSYVLDAVCITKKELNGRVPLIGFSGAPWTLAAYMVEGKSSKNFHHIKSFIYQDPILAHKLLEKIAIAVTAYLEAKIDSGCDAVQIFDTWAGLLSPWDFREFSLKYIYYIVERVKRKNVPIIVFAKGAAHSYDEIAASGCNVVGIDWVSDIGKVRSMIGDRVAIQGNMDPTILLAPLSKIEDEVKNILSRYGEGTGHIFNLGHGILPETPVENARFFVHKVKELSRVYHK
jgi:uroporphyrinogen decarboxylase